MSVSDITVPVDGPPTSSSVVSELLCFVTEKCNLLPLDDLVKICTNFYTESEVINARNVIDSIGTRLPKRKSPDKHRLTVEDIVKCVLDPTVNLPEFHAKNLARLPPVDVVHCDISAILIELQGLRLEVRNMGQMKDEIHALKLELEEIKSTVAEYRKQIGELQPASLLHEWPSINQQSTTASLDNFRTLTNTVSSQPPVARPDLKGHSESSLQDKTKKPTKKLIIGASAQNKHVKSVATTRNVDVFISRLHPETSSKELLDCAHETASTADITVVDISCTQLKSKYESLYSSFYVSIRIDVFMSAEAWPSGVLVKRFFKPKNG